MAAILLALGASLSYGVGDFLGGATARKAHVLSVLVVSQAAGAAAVVVWVVAAHEPFLGLPQTVAAMVAGLCGVTGLAALYRGMAIGAMGVVAPISSMAAAIPFAAGIARGERPSLLQVAGAVVALAGLGLVSRSPGELGSRRAAGVGSSRSMFPRTPGGPSSATPGSPAAASRASTKPSEYSQRHSR